jgi:hypothetical protein
MSSAGERFAPGQLWGLWEMINFMLPHYMAALRLIHQELSLAQANLHGRQDEAVDGHTKDMIRQNFQYVKKKAEEQPHNRRRSG